MRDSALRLRVERLLRGDFVVDDLTQLFLSVRLRSYGRKTVKEIGDFVAHGDERNQGFSTVLSREFFKHLRMRMPYYDAPLDWNDLPSEFPEALKINLERTPAQILTRDTGFRPKEIKRLLPELLSRFSRKPNGRYHLSKKISHEEAQLISVLVGHVTVKAALNEDILCNEFRDVLVKNELLLDSESGAFSQLKPLIALYAIAAMHQCNLLLDDGFYAQLYVGLGEAGLEATVSAACPTAGIPTLQMAAALFSTSLQAADWCDAALLEALNTNPNPEPVWTYGIEIGPDRKLRKLG